MQAQTAPHGVQCPPVPSPQVSGSRLRLLQVTAADSGEYVCRVSSGATTKEASVMVTIQPSGASSYREWGPGVTLPTGCPYVLQHRAGFHVLLPVGLSHCHNVTLLSLCPASGGTTPLRIESSSSTVTEGQTLDLNCVIASPAQATVTWYKRGGSLPARHQVRDV